MSIKVTRTIVLTYANEDVYNEDRQHWLLSYEGAGNFGSAKQWSQRIEVEEDVNAV